MGIIKKLISWSLVMMIVMGSLSGCAPQKQEIITFSVQSELKNLNFWDDGFRTTITLKGYQWTDQIMSRDIVLTQAFTGMTVENVERISDTQLVISAKGEIQDAFSAGTITFSGSAILNPHEEEEQKGIQKAQEANATLAASPPVIHSVDIAIHHPDAEIFIEDTGGSDAVIMVRLTECAFTDQASKDSFSFMDTLDAPSVMSAVKKDDQTMLLTLSSVLASDIDALYAQISDATLCISGNSINTGKELQTPVSSYASQIAIAMDYVDETADGFLVTLLLSCSNGSLNELMQDQIMLGGDFNGISSLNAIDDHSAELKVLVNKEGKDLDTLTFDGHVQINGQWGESLWGSPCSNANLAVHYTAQEASKALLAVETGLMYDLLKTGFTALATSIGKSAGNRMMEAINSDMFSDETVRQLTDMNKSLQKMDDKWTDILDSVDTHLALMEDKIGSNNCSRVLDEYDTLAATLQATVMHLENKKASVDSTEKETPEYEAAKREYIRAVEGESCKVYTNAYVLGQKILKGSAGLSSGVVGTYDELLSLLYNFDVQTYDLKEDFRVMTLSLYLKAYDQAVLYYQLTDPNNALLKQLESQLVSISKLLDGMKVIRRTDNKIYCYAAGKTLKRYVVWVLGPSEYTSTQITGTHVEKMISRAQYRNTTLGTDMDQAGFCTYDRTSMGLDILIADSVRSKQLTSTKREWWTTMTKVNIRTHAIEKNVMTYYQRSEKPWYEFFNWTQKECWGVYEYQGFMLQNE